MRPRERRRLGGMERGRAIVPVLLLAVLGAARWAAAGAAGAAGNDEDWASSPEAYFLTAAERAEWKSLESRESRRRFQERYWLRRDPSAGTEKNEFRDLVLGRIQIADKRFSIEKTPGSRTARGLVFIVLGSPARVVDAAAPRPPADAGRRPIAFVEGNETTSNWFYETDRTPRILEAIGRPSLQITIVVEPSRRQDSIQNPGLFHEVQEIVARKSIVNPDLVAAEQGAGEVFPADVPSSPRQALGAVVRGVLEAAPPAARGPNSFAGAVSVFHDSGAAECVVWLSATPAGKNGSFSGLVRSDDGREVAAWSEPAVASSLFSTQSRSAVFARRFPIAPGAYSVSVAVTDPAGGPSASASLPIRVPALEGRFAVSSVVLTAGPAEVSAGQDRTFVFGKTALPPRADATFQTSQSVWYFVVVAAPSDPSRVIFEPRLRRGGEALASLAPFPARLEPIGGGRYLAGIELPLSTLSPGDYVLYLAVRDGTGAGGAPPLEELRRAEFRVIP